MRTIEFTGHALDEMADEMVDQWQVRQALVDATACDYQENDRWKVRAGFDLVVIVEIQAAVIVVTVFGEE